MCGARVSPLLIRKFDLFLILNMEQIIGSAHSSETLPVLHAVFSLIISTEVPPLLHTTTARHWARTSVPKTEDADRSLVATMLPFGLRDPRQIPLI